MAVEISCGHDYSRCRLAISADRQGFPGAWTALYRLPDWRAGERRGGARTHRLNVEALVSDLNRVANGQEAEGIKPATKAPVGRGIPLQVMGRHRIARFAISSR